jgi:hypothetical protein
MRVRQKRSKEDSYPNTVGQGKTSYYKTLTDIATNIEKHGLSHQTKILKHKQVNYKFWESEV